MPNRSPGDGPQDAFRTRFGPGGTVAARTAQIPESQFRRRPAPGGGAGRRLGGTLFDIQKTYLCEIPFLRSDARLCVRPAPGATRGLPDRSGTGKEKA